MSEEGKKATMTSDHILPRKKTKIGKRGELAIREKKKKGHGGTKHLAGWPDFSDTRKKKKSPHVRKKKKEKKKAGGHWTGELGHIIRPSGKEKGESRSIWGERETVYFHAPNEKGKREKGRFPYPFKIQKGRKGGASRCFPFSCYSGK